MPPLPPNTDVAKVLNTDILVYPQDDDETIQNKINLAKVKEYLAEYLAEGGEVTDFLGHYHYQLSSAYTLRQAAHQEMLALLRDGDSDAAELYVLEANKILDKEGIMPISFTPEFAAFAKKRGEELRRAREQEE